MQNPKKGIDLPQAVFSIIFIIIMIITSFWIISPFILGFSWASMVVISTWPFMLKIQSYFWNIRIFAVIFMIFILLLLFILPSVFLINNLIDNSTPLINWLTSGNLQFPTLIWLQDIPVLGQKIYLNYQKLLSGGGASLISKVKPYMGRTTEFFISQISHFFHFFIHLIFMLIFSSLLYWKGEKVSNLIRNFASRVSSQNGDAIVLLAGQAIRSVAVGVVVTALIQGILSWLGLLFSGIPYASLLMALIIFFCLIQIGPLFILTPAVLWLYWHGNNIFGTILLVWSCILFFLDHFLRPLLIRIGADLPNLLILSGVIGGLISFGMIGLFIGPVILLISYRLILSWIYQKSISDIISKKITNKMPKKYK
ncbi:AI-2E family transporter YdiK [Buchnera aphidicola (Neophyllaphis podocarpi)]|uniref:AI-2E family transporter YdiK n=1 Tax=Buchnera aphidicola TaxID=9 RepID=UPI0031B82BC1